ncbi:MAG: exodeoxyribonuclease VII large subunit [Pseudomonadota bacterium]|nr:exodeoxyribonuclease VII large subunit [Pseudomonadota bacterium]
MNPPAPTPGRTVYAVSELTDILRALIEDALPRVWVQGEISNLSKPASGHWYFTLKDAKAQMRCAMFRNSNLYIRPIPKDGDQVLIRAQVSLYGARGDLQLICEHMEPAGEGALLREFEALRKRLAAEGLFDEAIKRTPPPVPRRIGIITSATGAAIHDILSTLERRFPLAPVVLYPVPVQGNEAPPAIIRALRELPRRGQVDVVILARGGGSLEDLWAFNDENVARAIRACTVPVICGVGHEVDVTIADFAADLRAPTPTAAAERVAPDIADWRRSIEQNMVRIARSLQRQQQNCAQTLDTLHARLRVQHPARRLQERGQRLDELQLRSRRAMLALLGARTHRAANAQSRLHALAPNVQINQGHRALDSLAARLRSSVQQRIALAGSRWQRSDSSLQSLNPRAVLQRGYAIALDASGKALTSAQQTGVGAKLQIVLAEGQLDTTVDRKHGND